MERMSEREFWFMIPGMAKANAAMMQEVWRDGRNDYRLREMLRFLHQVRALHQHARAEARAEGLT